jgi:phosphatidate phosphatase APP1
LEKGTDGIESNPFFYVSSSPWNLYGFLMEFLDVHRIPKGPLMLRDLGLSREQFIAGSHAEHKLKQIEHILEVFTDLSFILIGDSGQKDPEIYLAVVKEFPGRVKMIYIRDVSSARTKEVEKIAREVKDSGVELMLVKDTMEAASHAVSKGWIDENNVIEIAQVKQKDEQENQ